MNLLVIALTVLTLNLNGVHNTAKWEKIWNEVPKLDIICFQETHLVSNQLFTFQLYAQSYDWWHSCGTSASAGLSVAVKHSTGVNIVKAGEILGQCLVLDETCQVDGLHMCLINLYAPNELLERSNFFMEVSTHFT